MSSGGRPGRRPAVSNAEAETPLTEADVDPVRMDDFALRLAELPGPKTTVEPEVFWRVFIKAFPHRPRGDESRRVLLRALRYAEEKGVIRIPPSHGKLWERAFAPALPRCVYRVDDRPAADRSWRDYPWGKDLQWVRRLPSLTRDELSLLKRVHEGIRDGIFLDPVPLKNRSLQLTGHEKRLAKMAKGRLFGPGKLSLEVLGCLPDEHPPIAWYAIASDPSVLVVENKTAFSVIRGVLRSLPEPPYGMVAYGGGNAFMQSVQDLAQIGRPVHIIHYIGDLDRPGLFIARTAAATARRAGLPPVIPAPALHRLMLDAAARMGHPNGMEYKEVSGTILESDDELLSWLPEDVRAGVASILNLGRRVPEEILLPRDLRGVWTDSGQ
jgi:hypothetical protein